MPRFSSMAALNRLPSRDSSRGRPNTLWSSSGGVFLTNNNNGTFGHELLTGSQYMEVGSQSSIYQVINGFVAGDQYVLGADFAGLPGEPSTNFTMLVTGAAFDGTSVSTFSRRLRPRKQAKSRSSRPSFYSPRPEPAVQRSLSKT